MRIARPVVLNIEQFQQLQRWARSRSLPARLVERSRIVLLAAQGKQDIEIGAELSISPNKAEVIARTTQTKPANATHWSTRTLGAELGISDSSVLRIWRANGLKPHLVERPRRSPSVPCVARQSPPAFVSKTDAPVAH